MMTTIQTSRFGALAVDSETFLTIPEGMIGFPSSTRFVVLEHFRPAPFRWLQSADQPDLAFAIMDPADLPCDYRITLRDDDLRGLGRVEESEFMVFVVLTVRSAEADGMTANLRGPVIVNERTRIGKQVALVEDLPTRFPVLTQPSPSVIELQVPVEGGMTA